MSSPQGSPASPSAWPGSAGERMMTATSGRRLFVPSMRSGPLGSWVRMCLGSRRWYSPARKLIWGGKVIYSMRITYTERSRGMSSTASVRTSRTQDIPSSRVLFRLVPSELRTGGTGYGLSRGGKMTGLLPTPRAMEVEESPEHKAARLGDRTPNSMPNLSSMARFCPDFLPSPVASLYKGGVRNIRGARADRPGLLTLADMATQGLLPTPLAVSVRHSKRCQELRSAGDVPFHSRVNGETRPNGLEDYLEFNGLMPSPVSQDYRRRGPNSRQQGLPELCHKLMPTPTAMDSSEATARMKSSQVKDGSMHSVTLARAVQSQDSKDGRASQLNPLFVGEMMGYPLTWLTSPFLSGNGERRP